jgi:hypothetical protein
MLQKLWSDESGFIISAELVMVATILVIGLIVGLSEVQHAVVGELNDVADSIGSANQSYGYSGFAKRDGWWGWGWGGGWGGNIHAWTVGSTFVDVTDACDNNQCALACNPPVIEFPKGDNGVIIPYHNRYDGHHRHDHDDDHHDRHDDDHHDRHDDDHRNDHDADDDDSHR